jgi:hypothetical protein
MKAYDSVRREVLYNILIEFGIPMKLVRLIRMCLNETYSKVHVGKHLLLLHNLAVITVWVSTFKCAKKRHHKFSQLVLYDVQGHVNKNDDNFIPLQY